MQKARNNFPSFLLPISRSRRSMAPASPRRCRVSSSAHAQPTSTSHAGAQPHRRRSAVLVIPVADAMDRLLLSRPPLPVAAHAAAGADGDLLELDVLWPASTSASPVVGLGLLAALPDAAGLAASGIARSAPVRIPLEPMRRGRRPRTDGGRRGRRWPAAEDRGGTTRRPRPDEEVASRSPRPRHSTPRRALAGFCVGSVGDRYFCLRHPSTVDEANSQMPFYFCTTLLESV